MAGPKSRLAESRISPNGLFCLVFRSSSPSESGTWSEEPDLDNGFRATALRGMAVLPGGAARRRDAGADCIWLSYSTDVLRGTAVFGREEPEAHELLGFVTECMSDAAWVNAVAILTVVSLTSHFSGFGGEVMILGPPGRDKRACSRCLILAKRASAGSFSSSSSFVDVLWGLTGDVGFVGDRGPRVGALHRKTSGRGYLYIYLDRTRIDKVLGSGVED